MIFLSNGLSTAIWSSLLVVAVLLSKNSIRLGVKAFNFDSRGGSVIATKSMFAFPKGTIKRNVETYRLFSTISDYDPSDLDREEKVATVDENEEDESIRDALKREILLLASITNRGECASKEELDILVDLVTQLEALNPTSDPAYKCEGDWDLCLSSTQFFRSSPFFMSLRSLAGEENKGIAKTGFDIHEKATSASRIGKVCQTITSDELTSDVELKVGVVPGFPIALHGTVETKASLDIIAADTWELAIKDTKVKGADIDIPLSLPMGDIYSSITGSVPLSIVKTFYVDEGMRITRDEDDNFFVFVRA